MTFVLLTLAAYRLQRFITLDTVPGGFLRDRLNHDSYLYELISCGWCVGSWVTFAVFAVASQLVDVANPVLQGAAAAALVGLLFEWETRS